MKTHGASHLECTACGTKHPSEKLQGLSPCCHKPLYARYDLAARAGSFRPEMLRGRRADLWRYLELLPLRDERFRPGLGAGFTPLVPAPVLAKELGAGAVFIKDESQNPTASFKARGLALAVARGAELGASSLALPSAGNAAAAAAAYGAALGLPVQAVVPSDTPAPILAALEALGAKVTLVDGVITDCARVVAKGVQEQGWFDLSTLKEPYRVEGKKTMGFELYEQLGGQLPEVIIYPTGGGTGLLGMWKAFEELEALGWIDARRPRMIAVQSSGCAPIPRAFASGATHAEPWSNPHTYAAGLRVPAAMGDFLILKALRDSGGRALAVEDRHMAEAVRQLGSKVGIFACPEGGATLAAAELLAREGDLKADDRLVLFNTGGGFSYVGSHP